MADQEVQNGGCDNASDVGFSAVKSQLLVEAPKANDAVQFYKAAFGAVEIGRVTQPKRKADQELPHIISAHLMIAGFSIVVSDLADDSAPVVNTVGTRIALSLETVDIEAAIAKAVENGAVAEGEIRDGDDAICGGRVGKIKDPYGFVWLITSPAKKTVADVEA